MNEVAETGEIQVSYLVGYRLKYWSIQVRKIQLQGLEALMELGRKGTFFSLRPHFHYPQSTDESILYWSVYTGNQTGYFIATFKYDQ